MKSNWNFTDSNNSLDARGAPQTWQITFNDGSVETFTGHQLIQPLGGSSFSFSSEPERIMVHGEIDGRWRLIYSVDAAYVREVRLLGSVNTQHWPSESRLDKDSALA